MEKHTSVGLLVLTVLTRICVIIHTWLTCSELSNIVFLKYNANLNWSSLLLPLLCLIFGLGCGNIFKLFDSIFHTRACSLRVVLKIRNQITGRAARCNTVFGFIRLSLFRSDIHTFTFRWTWSADWCPVVICCQNLSQSNFRIMWYSVSELQNWPFSKCFST